MISLIITFYKQLEFIELVLESIQSQSFKDFEVIIAEDDQHPETPILIKQFQKKVHFPILHVHQIDHGFRRCSILNKAIQISNGEKLVFIDSDCILHRHFLNSYNKNLRPGIYLYGRRYNLNNKQSDHLLNKKNIQNLLLIRLWIQNYRGIENTLYIPWRILPFKNQEKTIWGCNWGVIKKHIYEVNGWDEDYKAYGLEDNDMDWRLKLLGLKIESLRNQSIIYHLFHKTNINPEKINENPVLLDKKIKEGKYFCSNGLDKSGEFEVNEFKSEPMKNFA